MIKTEVGIKKLTFTVYNAIDVMSLDQKNICWAVNSKYFVKAIGYLWWSHTLLYLLTLFVNLFIIMSDNIKNLMK